MLRKSLLASFCAGVAAVSVPALADPIPEGWQAVNMEPVGYADLGDRNGGGKLGIMQTDDGRWYLVKGGNGFTVIDVTDVENPVVVAKVDGPEGTQSSQISLHDNILLLNTARPITAEESSGRADGWTTVSPQMPEDKPFEETVRIYDLSDPHNPQYLSRWGNGAQGSHRNVYPGGDYAYLSTTVPGYAGFMLVILDVSDPSNPQKVGQWAYPGAKEGEESDAVTTSYHGPAFVSPDGNMLTLGYTPSVVNLDITDISDPQLIGELKLIPPFPNTLTQAIHTVVPLWDRGLLYWAGEPMKRNCDEPMSYAGFIDNSDPENPFLLSIFPSPKPPEGAPYKSFCDKGGRFGPHNAVTEIHNPLVQTPDHTMYIAWFTAGVRAFDITNPVDVQEIGWFLPPDPEEPVYSQGGMLDAAATQEVLQDTRGNIFMLDSAWGVWILRDTR